jgi:hypothetical protein
MAGRRLVILSDWARGALDGIVKEGRNSARAIVVSVQGLKGDGPVSGWSRVSGRREFRAGERGGFRE